MGSLPYPRSHLNLMSNFLLFTIFSHSHFFQKIIQILKRRKCEIATPGTQIDLRCMQPRFKNSPYYAWSIRRDVGQVLHRQTFPCSSYDALLARGQGPDSAETNPFTSIRDAMKTACVELVKNTL